MLCFLDADSGEAFSCKTALDTGRIGFHPFKVSAERRLIRFELGAQYSELSPYTIILEKTPEIYEANAKISC